MKRHLFVLVLALVASALSAQSAADLVGSRPELRIATLDDGEFDLARQRGKWVVLNYWATWCAPCIKEIPELSELADRDDVEVLGLDFEDIEREELDAFLVRHPARYPIAPVDPFEPPTAFPVPRGLPMTYLIDPEGIVVQAFLGPVTRAEIEREMARASAGSADDEA
jgi:thiol-disulfide isomerase/thioredoxin